MIRVLLGLCPHQATIVQGLDHIVYQAVVAFPDAMAASEFYESQVSEWGQCDDQRVDLHDAGDPNAHYWTLSEAADENGILTITREQEESTRGWSCQRALTAENNVVADVSACAYDVDDSGRPDRRADCQQDRRAVNVTAGESFGRV